MHLPRIYLLLNYLNALVYLFWESIPKVGGHFDDVLLNCIRIMVDLDITTMLQLAC